MILFLAVCCIKEDYSMKEKGTKESTSTSEFIPLNLNRKLLELQMEKDPKWETGSTPLHPRLSFLP